MKKLLLIAAIIAALIIPVFALAASAPGTVTISYTSLGDDRMVVTFTCTASKDDATFPATSTSATNLKGYYITEVRTNPGAVAPQAAYDIVINDTDGIDLMGGTLINRSATVSERAVPLIATNTYGKTMVDGALSLEITGNNVNSAQTVVKMFLAR